MIHDCCCFLEAAHYWIIVFFDDLRTDHISSRAEKSPCKKLVNKFHKQKSCEQQSVRLRHQNTEGENKTRRLVRSMFVEPSQGESVF